MIQLSGLRSSGVVAHCARNIFNIMLFKCLDISRIHKKRLTIFEYTLLTFFTYLHTYIPLTIYPLMGSRGISDIPPRHPRFTKYS
jgi:hypothetical protein